MKAVIRFLMTTVRVGYPFIYMLFAIQFLVLLFTPASTGGHKLYPMLAPVLPLLGTLTTILAAPFLILFKGLAAVLPDAVLMWFPVAEVENTMLTLGHIIDAIPLMTPVATPILGFDWANIFGGGFHWAYLAAIWMWMQLEKPVNGIFDGVEARLKATAIEARSEKLRQRYEKGEHIPDAKKNTQPVTMIFDRPKKPGGGEMREVVDALKTENEALKNRARRDPLTGLYNKEVFTDTLARETELGRQAEGRLTLMLVDIDNFKAVNDTYGHPQGDAVLKAVSDSLFKLRVSSGTLTPCRIGGEELGLLAVSADPKEIERLAENFRRSVEQLGFKHPSAPDGVLKVTVSIGLVAVNFNHATDSVLLRPEDLLARADELLYRAKSNGKNRVEIWRVD